MLQISAFHAKNTLGSLLDRAEAGEETLITRHGHPVARLVPASEDHQRLQARAAVERIRARAKEMKLGPFNWEEWKAMRDEGKR